MRRLQTLLTLALALLFIGADPPPLDPDLRAAAPEGWLVVGKGEGIYTWLRFSASEALEGEDLREDAITLYRIPVAVPPAKAGGTLAEIQLEKQKIHKREAVTRTIESVRWQGVTAEYFSKAGTARRERYLYADRHEDTLYIFWDRGPAAGWEASAPVREETLRKVSAILAGRPAADEAGAAERDENDAPEAEPAASEGS